MLHTHYVFIDVYQKNRVVWLFSLSSLFQYVADVRDQLDNGGLSLPPFSNQKKYTDKNMGSSTNVHTITQNELILQGEGG